MGASDSSGVMLPLPCAESVIGCVAEDNDVVDGADVVHDVGLQKCLDEIPLQEFNPLAYPSGTYSVIASLIFAYVVLPYDALLSVALSLVSVCRVPSA